MTRINLQHPTVLSNKHLVAEWNEAPRCITRAEERYRKHGHPGVIPSYYRLGTGHESFFYNKLSFILDRLDSIFKEMQARGMSPQEALLQKHHDRVAALPSEFHKSFTPTDDEKLLSLARLYRREPSHYTGAPTEIENSTNKRALVELYSHD